MHSFACPSRMAPSKFHVNLHSRVWATNTLSKSITRNQLTLIILFLFNKYELFSMSIQTLTPWSLHSLGTTCSPLSLEDPNAWKLHIACSNSGLHAHRLCTKSSFSSFQCLLYGYVITSSFYLHQISQPLYKKLVCSESYLVCFTIHTDVAKWLKMNDSEYSQIYLIEKANQTYVVHKPIQTGVLYPNIMSKYNQLQFNDCY
jgi:hypothetical protein